MHATARGWRLIASLAAMLIACDHRATPVASVVIPRWTGPVEVGAAPPLKSGPGYWPVDYAVAWPRADSLIVWHWDEYGSFDVMDTVCEGSGLYMVPVAGGSARSLSVGGSICGEVAPVPFGSGSPTVDRTGTIAIGGPVKNSRGLRLNRFDLRRQSLDTVVVTCHIENASPALSPDARTLAATAACGDALNERYGVYLIPLDGAPPRRVSLESDVGAGTPAWSNGGGQIAYVRSAPADAAGRLHRVDDDDPFIVVMDTARSHRQVIGLGTAPAWSPDDHWIAYLRDSVAVARRTGIRVIHPDGSGDRELFLDRERPLRPQVGSVIKNLPTPPLVWSPDGRSIAFSRMDPQGISVWVLDVATGAVRQLTRADSSSR